MLAFGVPFAIERLWVVAGSIRGAAFLFGDALWIRAVLVLVALLWCRMLIRLLLDLRRALSGNPLPGRNWSSRWASSIAALAIVASAGHVAAGHPHKAPTSVAATNHVTAVRHPLTAVNTGQLRQGECLADVAARVLAEPEQWSVLAAANMGSLLGPEERFVDPSLVRTEWCLALPTTAATPSGKLGEVTPSGHGPNILEELEWLGLGVLGTAALIRRLRALRLVARASRDQGERLRQRDLEIEALEARLDPFGDAILLDWIEAGNRLLRLATSELAISPVVRLVRAGPSGVTFYFETAEAVPSKHFVVGEGGYSWTLSLGKPLERITALANGVGRYAPWLVPVGDDGEDAWLVAVGPGQSLAVDSDEVTAEEVIRGITTALRTLPWAEELSVELLGVDPPPVTEHCYQMASSSTAALLDLAADPPSPRNAQAAGSWRREPLIVTRSAHETAPLPDRVTAMAGVIRPGRHGTVRLCLDQAGARLVPVGVSLNVPRPNEAARSLIERLLARAASIPLLNALPAASDLTEPARAARRSRHVVRLELLRAHPSATGLTGELSERDRPRVVELLSYLALHRGAATQLELMTALFPRAGADAHRRLDTVLVAARRALGDQQLLITGNGVVTLEAMLRSDWVDLLTELARSRSEDEALALSSLSLILDCATWRPGLPYRWMLTEGLLDHLCFEVCDAMHQLSRLASAGGDLELAARSIHAGLALEPTSELLVRDLMVLRSELDGLPGLIEVYEALEGALGAAGGVEPSWATRALFDELAGKHA
jgi:hypothetical protein